MAYIPKDHREEEVLEVTDAEEAVFEALLPAYLGRRLDIEQVRQVSPVVASLLEDVSQGIADAEAGRFYTEEEYRRMRSKGE